MLESRWVFSAPTLAAISDVTLYAGAPLHIALDGFDADGDALTYTVSSTNAALTTTVPQGNRSMKISVQGYGDMVFELFEDLSSRTTSRIIELIEKGYYNGLVFHRIIDTFMIQGGDPLGEDPNPEKPGTGGTDDHPTFEDTQNHFPFDDEFHPDLQHTSSGLLSMAKSGDDTNDSQFFITDRDTRHLDFNHSIFGFLTKGDDVRSAINSVPTTTTTGQDDKNRPLTPVKMNSVSVFHDQEDGVLRLSAAQGTTGNADITVTVSDGKGGTAQRTFRVTIQADQSNAPPYLAPISPVQTTAGTPVSFPLAAIDVEGSAVKFDGIVSPANANLQMSVNSSTGVVTVTPGNGLAGIHSVLVGVQAASGSDWDTQLVPLYIAPKAPTGIQLLGSSDTGASNSDRITNLDNTSAKTLTFQVSGVVSGAEVSLYDAGNNLIGRETATGNTVTIVTYGDSDLTDGVHSITAVQRLLNQQVNVGNFKDTVTLVSEASSPLSITVDTAAPAFTSSPILGAGEGTQYVYDAQTNEESAGVRYQLTQAPAGMIVDLSTGRVTWTPTSSQRGNHDVTLRATDLAGNAAVDQSFQVSVNDAPVIQTIGNKQIQEGQTLTFTVAATDSNLPLTFSLEGAPQGASIHAQTGAFTWATTEAHGPGQYQLTVKVTDATGAASRETVTVTVSENNAAPALAAMPNVTVNEGAVIDFVAAGSDTDLPAQTLTYRLESGAPAGAAIHPQTGRFTWTPQESQGPGQYPISVTVSDSLGATASRTFTVTVVEVNRPPVFDPVAVQTVSPGDALQLTVQAADPDRPNPNPVRYSLEPGASEGAAIDAATGELVWDVPAGFAHGNFDLVVRATEVVGAGQTAASSTVKVQVVITGTGAIADASQLLIAELAFAGGDSSSSILSDAVLPLEGPASVDVALLRTGTFDERGLFGTRLASQGGMHQGEPTGADIDGLEGLPGALEKDSSGDRGDDIDSALPASSPNSQTAQVSPEAVDAAMEALAAEAASPETTPSEAAPPDADTVAARASNETQPGA